MSTGERIPLAVAQREATRVLEALRASGLFDRSEIAGSVRRGRETVRDLELVLRPADDEEFGLESKLAAAIRDAGLARAPPVGDRAAPWGRKYRKCETMIEIPTGRRPVLVDLFLVRPPARWGPVFAIRTGSAEFSQFVVTRLHAYGLEAREGRVVRRADGAEIPTDSEEEFFAAAHVRTPPPAEREIPFSPDYLEGP